MSLTVAVIIPCYNAERYLGQALESLLVQRPLPAEVLVVDDGSTDGSKALARSYANRLPISLLEQARQGPCAARNRGIQAARSDWLHFLDADDYLRPGMYASLESAVARVPDALGFHAGFEQVDHQGTAVYREAPRPPIDDPFHFLLHWNPWPCNALVVRRESVVQVGGFDVSVPFCEDWDLWLRVATRGGVFEPLDGVYACYRQHGESRSHDHWRMLRGGLEVLRRNAKSHGSCPQCRSILPLSTRAWRGSCWEHRFQPRVDRLLNAGQWSAALRLGWQALWVDPLTARLIFRRILGGQRSLQKLASFAGLPFFAPWLLASHSQLPLL